MTKATTAVIGLGYTDAHLNVYIGNRPAFDFKASDDKVLPASQDENYSFSRTDRWTTVEKGTIVKPAY